MNINDKSAINLCTSCQACAAVCPKEAISIELDEQGFYRPVVDNQLCVDCSLCTKVCYKYNNVRLSNEALFHYGASANEDEVLYNTTSGGIAYLLSLSFIEQGYKCVGVEYDIINNIAISSVANNKEHVEFFRGSKYIQSYTFDAFQNILRSHLDEKIAIFGTPCHIYAINRYLEIKNKRANFILVDLYCHGCPSLRLWQKYVKEVELLIKKENLEKIDFRSKIKGWGSFNVVVKAAPTKEEEQQVDFISSYKKNEFYELFFSDYMLNQACYECKLRSTLAYTDIRLGDFWGKHYVNNYKGVSAVSVVTEKGKIAIDQIKNKLKYQEHPLSDILAFQSYGNVYEYNETLRTKLFELLNAQDKSLSEVLKCYYSTQSIFQRAKRYLKFVIMLFPPRVIRFIKLVYYRFI